MLPSQLNPTSIYVKVWLSKAATKMFLLVNLIFLTYATKQPSTYTRHFSSFCGLSFQDLRFQHKTCTFSIVLLCCTNRLFILLLGLLASINVFMISTVLLTEKGTTYIIKSQKSRTIFQLCQHGWIEHLIISFEN